MHIILRGVRGSLPSPMNAGQYRKKIKLILKRALEQGLSDPSKIADFIQSLPEMLRFPNSGNTTCTEVVSAQGSECIIDCGTGIRELGEKLMEGPCGRGKGIIHIFFTHFHWDHIQGLPFFKPLMIEGNKIHFYSPFKEQEEYLKGQQHLPYFPAKLDQYASDKVFHFLDPLSEAPMRLDSGLVVDWFPLKHPGKSYAYRFREGNKTFIFATDAEFTGEILETVDQETDFFDNADLLIMDSQYTLQESFSKFDWGHSSYTMAVNCASRWNVRNLVLTHHDPAYDDIKLNENYKSAIEHARISQNIRTRIFLAREGLRFEL